MMVIINKVQINEHEIRSYLEINMAQVNEHFNMKIIKTEKEQN